MMKRRSAFLAEVVRLDVLEEMRRHKRLLILGPFGSLVVLSEQVATGSQSVEAPGLSLPLTRAKPAPYPGAAWTVGDETFVVCGWPLAADAKTRLREALQTRGMTNGMFEPDRAAGWPPRTAQPDVEGPMAFAIGNGTLRIIDVHGRLWRAPLTSTAAVGTGLPAVDEAA